MPVISSKDISSDGTVLGKGAFGEVLKGVYTQGESCCLVAIKKIEITANRDVTKVRREAETFEKLEHENIVKYFGFYQDVKYFFIVMKYMPNSLNKILDNHAIDLVDPVRIAIGKDVAEALVYLHGLQPEMVLHRDIKSDNVLLDDEFRAKLTDFGVSLFRDQSSHTTMGTETSKGTVGTPPWMAPEVLNGRDSYSNKSDVFSFGMVLWELLTRKRPHLGKTMAEIIELNVTQGPGEIIPEGVDDHYRDLLAACWRKNKNDRPTAEEALKRLKSVGSLWKNEIQRDLLPAQALQANVGVKASQGPAQGNNNFSSYDGSFFLDSEDRFLTAHQTLRPEHETVADRAEDEQAEDFTAAFYQAVNDNNVETIHSFIAQQQVNINAKNAEGLTALHLAVFRQCVDAFNYLLSQGADVSITTQEGHHVIHLAAFVGNVAIISTLIEEKNLDINLVNLHGHTPLYIAAQYNHKDLVNDLLKRGAKKDILTKKGWSALDIAAHHGFVDIVLLLIESQKDFGEFEVSSLYRATHAKQSGVIEKLVSQFPDIIFYQDKNNVSVFEWIVQHGELDIIKSLYETQKHKINQELGDRVTSAAQKNETQDAKKVTVYFGKQKIQSKTFSLTNAISSMFRRSSTARREENKGASSTPSITKL